MEPIKHDAPARVVGRYAIFGEIAAGGMATVHYGRLLGSVGFSRTVAIKRLHAQFANAPEFVSMFIDEAKLAARIRHPNVVQTLDVVATDGELFVVMDYVPGESLSRLWRACGKDRLIPLSIASAIVCGVLHGLHAAHEATDETGAPLGLVHRDVSPQNIMVGVDGVARLLDFGIAKVSNRGQVTGRERLKGKVGYMAPEQVTGFLGRESDLFSTGVVLWEVLTGQRLFSGGDPRAAIARIASRKVTPPTEIVRNLPSEIDSIVMRSLEPEPSRRYATAREMALDLEACLGIASPTQVGAWVESVAGPVLAERAAVVSAVESSPLLVDESAPSSVTSRVREPRELAPGSRASLTLEEGRLGQTTAVYAVGAANSGVRGALGRTRAWILLLCAVLAVAVAISGVAVVLHKRGVFVPPSAMALPSSTIAPGRSPGPTASPASARLDDARVAAPSVDSSSLPAASPSPQAPAGAEASHEHGATAPRPRPRAPERVTPPPDDCDPPFSLDAQGHKRWKAECFRKKADP